MGYRVYLIRSLKEKGIMKAGGWRTWRLYDRYHAIVESNHNFDFAIPFVVTLLWISYRG